MYVCNKCGNKEHFDEMNYVRTSVVLDENTGELQNSENEFLECIEVCCGVCNASSENGDIYDRNTDKPIEL